jgi:hypothetical protein
MFGYHQIFMQYSLSFSAVLYSSRRLVLRFAARCCKKIRFVPCLCFIYRFNGKSIPVTYVSEDAAKNRNQPDLNLVGSQSNTIGTPWDLIDGMSFLHLFITPYAQYQAWILIWLTAWYNIENVNSSMWMKSAMYVSYV